MIVQTVQTVKTMGGELEVTIETTPTIKSADFTADPSLKGRKIRANEASQKYKISQRTLTNWAKRGIVRTVEKAPKVLALEEASVARASAVYKALCEYHSKIHAGRLLSEMLLE